MESFKKKTFLVIKVPLQQSTGHYWTAPSQLHDCNGHHFTRHDFKDDNFKGPSECEVFAEVAPTGDCSNPGSYSRLLGQHHKPRWLPASRFKEPL